MPLHSQQSNSKDHCEGGDTPQWRTYQQYKYRQSVLQTLEPPERALLSLAVFVNGESPKFFLRITAPQKFELLRAVTEPDLKDVVNQLASACRLPVSPYDVPKHLTIKWERRTLNDAEFQRLYRPFATALTRYVANVNTRPSNIKDQMPAGSDFVVSYETAGTEHFEVEAVDATHGGKVEDPIAEWAIAFISNASASFQGMH